MDVKQCKVELFLKSGSHRFVTRKVRNVSKTGYIASDWGGNKYTQWRGIVNYYGNRIVVWGYSAVPISSPPKKWANDTF